MQKTLDRLQCSLICTVHNLAEHMLMDLSFICLAKIEDMCLLVGVIDCFVNT